MIPFSLGESYRTLAPSELDTFGIRRELLERLSFLGQSALVPVPEIDFDAISTCAFHQVTQKEPANA